MKNLLKVLLALFIVFGFVGCAAPEEETEGVKVALLVPFRGDQSYFDVTANGMALIEAEIEDAETTIIEMGRDQSKWENYYLDAAEGDYDIIIGGNWEASPTFEKVIAQFPDKKFINFDWDVAPSNANTYGMFYKANELGYLTGLVAGLVTKSDLPYADPTKNIIGAIGGMEFAGINDFLYGYIQGAQAVNPDVKIFVAYANNFGDPAKGKEIALNQYAGGADIIFHAAGGTGNGLFDAAVEANRYALGVDADQALLFKNDQAKYEKILTSGTKNVDLAILQAVQRHLAGNLPYGQLEILGIKENGVGLAKNDVYNALPAAIRDVVASYEAKVVSGEIVVKSALTLTADEWNAIKASVQP
jgi:basic membrane protein A